MSTINYTYANNTDSTKIRARAAYARKMARRRLITLTLAGLTFVVGINVLLAKHDAAVRPAFDRMIEQEARELDARTDYTNYIIAESDR